MKQLKMLSVITGLTVLTLFSVQTAKADVAVGNATTSIVSALSMAQAAGNFLNFGHIIQSANAGWVSIGPDGTRVVNGLQVVPGSAHGQAIFNVAGDPGASFYIVLPTTATLTQAGGKATMTLDTFTSSLPTSGVGYLDSKLGTGTVDIGATLRVGASQASGEYDGTFAVTFAYN